MRLSTICINVTCVHKIFYIKCYFHECIQHVYIHINLTFFHMLKKIAQSTCIMILSIVCICDNLKFIVHMLKKHVHKNFYIKCCSCMNEFLKLDIGSSSRVKETCAQST